MTFKEKLEQTLRFAGPGEVEETFGCPWGYGFEGASDGLCKGTWDSDTNMCARCWEREIPEDAKEQENAEEQEKHDLKINAEIILGYCDQYENCVGCPADDAACHDGEWDSPYYKPGSQRAVLDAFEAALPPEEEEVPTVRLPETVTVKIGPQEPVADDPVNHPSHYTAGGIECIDAIAAALTCQKDPMAAWLTGQVLKYLWRWPMKGGREDLRKARWYLDRLIGKVEEP